MAAKRKWFARRFCREVVSAKKNARSAKRRSATALVGPIVRCHVAGRFAEMSSSPSVFFCLVADGLFFAECYFGPLSAKISFAELALLRRELFALRRLRASSPRSPAFWHPAKAGPLGGDEFSRSEPVWSCDRPSCNRTKGDMGCGR